MRLTNSETRRALKITREMTDDPDVGYVLMPATIAEPLAKKKLIKIIGPSPYGEVRAVITPAGRRFERGRR